jgi:ABC-type branched-subunit amino acid transport system substrate-binding protein
MRAAQANSEPRRRELPSFHFLRLPSWLVLCALCACTVFPITRPVFKVGLVAPFEGHYRYVGYDAIYAARLAVREANANGGVAGHTVELVAFDDQGAVPNAVDAAHNLTLDSDVLAVIGHFRQQTTEAAQPIYAQAGLPTMKAGTVEGEFGGIGNPLCPLLEYLQDETWAGGEVGAHDILWLALEEDAAAAPVPTCLQDIPRAQQVPATIGASTLLLTGDPILLGQALSEVYAVGWRGTVAGTSTLGSPLFAGQVNPARVLFVAPYRWPDPDGSEKAFSAAYQAVGPHVPAPGPFALTTYETMQSLFFALERAQAIEPTVNRRTLAAHADADTLNRVYIHRWDADGRVELIAERIVTP